MGRMIAMKGLPCTGKSMLANSMAMELKCPVIELDDVRDSIASLVQSTPPTSPNPRCIDEKAFDSICRLALPILQSGLDLIIDSPLSQRSHLDRLLQLVSSSPGSTIVVFECKPQNKFKWQQWIEQRRGGARSVELWYKPSNWDELESLFQGAKEEGSTNLVMYDYDTTDVPVLVVNTAEEVRVVDVLFAVGRLRKSREMHRVDFHDWMDKVAKGLIEDEGVGERDEPKLFDFGDDAVHYHELVFIDKEDDRFGNCRRCLEPVVGPPAYRCNLCTLSMHVSCAELPHKREIKPRDYPIFLQEIQDKYSFPEKIKCDYCESHDLDFNECPECLFESFIRRVELPTILHHPCHEHPLCVMIVPVSFRSGFFCKACGDPGKNIRYRCYQCVFDYHLTCGLLVHKFKQMRHLHLLNIAFLSEHDESEEEFLCDACETLRNPKHWVYYCEKCEFASHLSCMSFDD